MKKLLSGVFLFASLAISINVNAEGVKITTLREGSGVQAKTGDKIYVNYTGSLTNGTIFDSSIDPKFGHVEPFVFKLGAGQVIKGFDIGIMGMKVGEKRKLEIDSNYGYGDSSIGEKIPPNSNLIFEIELIKIDNNLVTSIPVVTSPEVADISSKGALLKTTSTFQGNPAMTIRGICYTPSMAVITPSLTSGAICVASAMPLSNDWFGVYAMNLIPNTDYKFRGYATNSAGTGYSTEGYFKTKSITNLTPFITILSPIKSDIYQSGQQVIVKWKSSNILETSKLKLGLYFDIGDNYQLLFNANILNSGEQVLDIPADISVSGNYKIIIRTENYDDYWESDEFKIIPSSEINTTRMEVLTPNGGEKIIKNQKYNITWNSYGPHSGTNVYLTLMDDSINCLNSSVNGINMMVVGCQSEFTIAYDVTNIGTYTWDTNTKMSGPSTGPNSISVFNGDKFKIGVCGVKTGTCDYSNNYFSISSSGGVDPVIFGVSGPQSLKVNETGTWKVSAYNQYGGNLYYRVKWGDEIYYKTCSSSGAGCANSVMDQSQQSATFTHTYLKAGIYKPEFTVTSENTIRCITTPCPSNEGSAKTSLTVNVGNSIIACPLISQPSPGFCSIGKIKPSYGNDGCIIKYYCSLEEDNNCKIKEVTCPNGNTLSSNCLMASTCNDYKEEEKCPMYTPPLPGWCSDGIIISPPKNSNGCYGHPVCQSLSENKILRTLRWGIKGDDVKLLQEFLGLKADGVFGRGTMAKVKIWQKENGLYPDGLFGKNSRQKAGFKD